MRIDDSDRQYAMRWLLKLAGSMSFDQLEEISYLLEHYISCAMAGLVQQRKYWMRRMFAELDLRPIDVMKSAGSTHFYGWLAQTHQNRQQSGKEIERLEKEIERDDEQTKI